MCRGGPAFALDRRLPHAPPSPNTWITHEPHRPHRPHHHRPPSRRGPPGGRGHRHRLPAGRLRRGTSPARRATDPRALRRVPAGPVAPRTSGLTASAGRARGRRPDALRLLHRARQPLRRGTRCARELDRAAVPRRQGRARSARRLSDHAPLSADAGHRAGCRRRRGPWTPRWRRPAARRSGATPGRGRSRAGRCPGGRSAPA